MPNIRRTMPHTASIGTRALQDASVTAAKLAAASLTPASIAGISVTTDVLRGTVPVVYNYINSVNATADYDVVIPIKCLILRCDLNKFASDGGAGDAFQLQTAAGAASITDSMSLKAVAGTTVAAGNLANTQVAAGATLRLAFTSATDCKAFVNLYVLPLS